MDHVINIAVKNKYAQLISGEYICGNSDFTVVFDFDEEWADLITKTARFITDAGETVDVLFDGDTCGVPVLLKAHKIFVGVYAGDLKTSTPAYVPARKSILCDAGTPRPQTPDIYAQIVSDIDGLKANNKFTLRKLRDYAYEMTCLDIDYEAALEYYASREAEVPPACSTIRNGNYIGRNLDWTYDQKATFVVHIPHSEDHRASVNLCGGLNELTEEFVRSANVSKAYKVLPCNAYDGINESGVVASMLVVPTDKGINHSVPIEDQREELPAPMLVRYILDHFDTAYDAADYIRKHVAVYFPAALHDMQYELHFMIADANDTYCLEFINNAAVVIDISEHPILTNFHISGTQLNDDGSVYTPDTQDATHNAHITNGITNHGAGLERFNLLNAVREFATSKSAMRSAMEYVKYSRTYPTAPYPERWLTEFVGGDLTCYAPPQTFEGIRAQAGEAYADRDRDIPKTWHTVHSSVYDIRNRTVSVVFQEDDRHSEIEFSIGADTAPKARAMFVEYGDESVDFSEIHAALDDHVPVYCVKSEGFTGIYEAVEYDERTIRFHKAGTRCRDSFILADMPEFGTGTNWSSSEVQAVPCSNPETKGNVFFTANGTHQGNGKYVGILFDNSEVGAENEEALSDNAEDPRIKLHGGTRNVDIMATTAEDGKNAVELLGDNKKDNTYLGGLLDPRAGHPHDAANKQYVDDQTIIFNANLPHDGWEIVEPEDEDADPTYEQTIEAPDIAGIKASDHVALQLCPRPDSIAAWNNYGIVCVEAAGGNGEGPGMLRFTAHRRPATNETIYINAILVR